MSRPRSTTASAGARRARLAAVAVVAAAPLLAACPQEALECVEVDPQCAPLYEPTFANVYAMTIEPKCSVSGSCHAGASPRGGLDLSTPDGAYAALLQAGEDRVIPGEPSCSEVVMRAATELRQYRMPPGNDTLSAPEQCAVQRWIAAGAPR